MTIATSQAGMAPRANEREAARVRAKGNKTISTALWVCAMLVAAEGAVRLRAWYRHGSDGPVAAIYETDELLGRRPRPGASMKGYARNLTINRWGFRGRDFPKTKPPGVTRIAAVGDSTTFGMEASSDETVWVARMTDLLNAATPGDG